MKNLKELHIYFIEDNPAESCNLGIFWIQFNRFSKPYILCFITGILLPILNDY